MNRPWFQFHTRDWLDNKELRRCSATARAVLADLMCLAHEGTPYGYLADDIGPLTETYMASRCVLPAKKFSAATAELVQSKRLVNEGGVWIIPRMVRDEEIRLARAAGGSLGGNPTIPRKVAVEVNHSGNHINEGEVNFDLARAHVPRSDSDSGIGSVTAFELKSLSLKEKTRVELNRESDAWFDSFFWLAWPVKRNKEDARIAARKIHESEREVVIAGVKLQSPLIATMEHPIHASTWLNKRRWEDEYIPSTAKTNGHGSLFPVKQSFTESVAAGLAKRIESGALKLS